MAGRKRQGLYFYERKKKVNFNIFREALMWLLYGAIAAFLAVVLVYAFGTKVSVIGASMEPGIVSGQSCLIDTITYRISSPQRYDVIAFYPGGNEEVHPYVKRVVGMPGDTVQIENGVLLVNGIPDISREEYSNIQNAGNASSEILLQEDEYFVLGDNPDASEDSRSASIGAVKLDSVIGKAWLTLPSEDAGMGRIN